MTAADHDWLDMRAPFDDAARERSLVLLDEAAGALVGGPDAEPFTVIDIGAGTGNSARWFDRALRTRLPGRALRWVLLDADAASLRAAARAMPEAVTVTAPITDLPAIAAAHLPGVTGEDPSGRTTAEQASGRAAADRAPGPPAPARLLITCSAVLDVLTPADVDAVIGTLTRFSGLGMFLLSITEHWPLDPPDRRDALIEHAFSEHQAREGRLGDAGGAVLAAAARRAGARVTTGGSPWNLQGPRDRQFLTRFLSERIDAVIEEDPQLRPMAAAWLADRLEQAGTDLRVAVEHLDVLVDARG